MGEQGRDAGLAKSLARELGPYGIGVNAVSPGRLCPKREPGLADRLQQDWIIENQSLNERIQPTNVADLVLSRVGDLA